MPVNHITLKKMKRIYSKPATELLRIDIPKMLATSLPVVVEYSDPTEDALVKEENDNINYKWEW